MSNQSYFNERSEKTTKRIREIISEMPDFIYDFFVGVENNTSPLTRLNYAYDLRIFFKFLMEETNLFPDKKNVFDFEIEDLEKVKTSHIERFLSFVAHYENAEGNKKSNGERGKARKLSTLRSFFKYFYQKDMLTKDVASKVQTPKIHTKEIIRLENNEVRKFLNEAETGFDLQGNAKGYHKHTSVRDTAMLTLMLGTGIRVSECVGLNLDDIDFAVNGISITRKGGNQVVLYISDEVKNALIDWLEEREKNTKIPPTEQALFVSLQNKRITVRAVQNLVKKYAKITAPLKKITPHKLRSTYGTALYRETQDIYIVADVLGHKDVNTTKKHYAAISDDIRRAAANKVKLRDN